MKIECVITCVGYADFLATSLPENLDDLDDVVVVTTPEDRETRDLCRTHSVRCIDTEHFRDRRDKFNKALGLNLGLGHLRQDDWVLHLDADVVLPDGFRRMLKHARLDAACIYGADRVNVRCPEAWRKHRAARGPQYRHHFLVHPPADFPLGARLIHSEYGYCPIGFFQLWHGSAGRRYPVVQGTAEHTDVLHSLQWDHAKRRLLPEVVVYHLETGDGRMGVNWQGRKTPRWGEGEAAEPAGPKCYSR